jgi:Ca2+-binding RTX toxin-like protein
LFGGTGSDLLYGDAKNISDSSRGAADWLDGGAGDDGLYGDADDMDGSGQGSTDRLYGGAGNDYLYGDALRMRDNTHGAADVLIGGTGNDHLYGDMNLEFSDLTHVTRGADRFVFTRGSDHDTIGDFEDNKDRIDLTGYHGIDGFAEVRTHASQSGADTVIDLGAAAGGAAGADVLTLSGIALATLDARDFLFA